MLRTGLHNISRFYRDNSTVRMSHKVRVDTIHIRDSSIGQDLGISFSLSLTIKVTISVVSPGSKVVSSSNSISMVVRSHSSVDMVNKLSFSLSLTIKVTVSNTSNASASSSCATQEVVDSKDS